MKKNVLVLGLALFAVFIVTRGSSLNLTVPKVGEPAPTFEGRSSSGKTISLADQKGHYVVLEWVNHGCPFVAKHYDSGNMQKLQSLYTKKDVVWLSVISSAKGNEGYVTAEQANADVAKFKAAPTAVILDPEGKIGRLYGAKTTPNMYIIDPKGTLIYSGAIDDKASTDKDDIASAKNYVSLVLDQALAGKPVSVTATKPYGCSVKY